MLCLYQKPPWRVSSYSQTNKQFTHTKESWLKMIWCSQLLLVHSYKLVLVSLQLYLCVYQRARNRPLIVFFPLNSKCTRNQRFFLEQTKCAKNMVKRPPPLSSCFSKNQNRSYVRKVGGCYLGGNILQKAIKTIYSRRKINRIVFTPGFFQD